MDLVALAPLPYRQAGRAEFEFGASTMSADLLRGLARLGHSVRAIAQAPPPLNGSRPSEIGSGERGLEVLPFAIEYRPVALPPPADHLEAQLERLRFALRKLVAQRRPDLVWLSGEALAWFALDVCREFELPALVAVHGAPLAGLEQGLYPPAETAELIARLATADGFVTVADHLRQMLERMGISGAVTVRNVVDARRFAPLGRRDLELMRALSVSDEQPVIGSFSSMRSEKRVHELVLAAPGVLERHPDAVFLLAGGGVLSDEVRAEVEARGLAASFRFPGEIDNQDMPRWLGLADVVVLASEREGYPLAVLEAQACGRAVVASDIPAIRELAADGRPVCTFPLGHPDALAEALLDLLDDPERRRAIERAGRRAALADDLDAWVRAHERVMEDVLELSRQAPLPASSQWT